MTFEKQLTEVEKEFSNKQIEEVKSAMREILTKIEEKKNQKEKLEEELRILKLDLEDLRSGKLDKIKERLNNSNLARGLSPLIFNNLFSLMGNPADWTNYTSGTYKITTNTNGNVSSKIYYF